MIDKNLILKSLDDAISKCRRSIRVGMSSLSNQIKGTLNRFADKTKNNTIEEGLIIGTDGSELLWSKGTYENVSYDEEDVRKALDMNNGKDLFFEHNHVGSFIDNDKKFEDMLQLTVPTLLSLPDMNTLFETLEYNGVKITPFKSITADSTNGTRMTVTRIDNEGEDLTNNHVLKNVSDSKYMVTEAWKNMYSRWATFFNQYNKNLKVFAINFRTEHYQDYYDKWVNSGKDDNVWKRYWNDYHSARDKFANDLVKDNFEVDVMQDSIKEFKDLGFELSMEWR